MSKKIFTPEEMEILSRNKYVKHVSEKGITYTEEYREHFYMEYCSGKLPTQIFMESGFNPKIIGNQRIHSFASRIKEQGKKDNGFADTRTSNSGRPRTKGLTLEEQLERLKLQNEILRQENDFLKRVRRINNKIISEASKNKKQKKSSN